MYLSRLILNPDNPRTVRALANAYALHQLLWQGFPGKAEDGPGRVLFRLEKTLPGAAPVALVQSELPPNWQAPSLRGCLLDARSKDLAALLAALRRDQLLRFFLRANPTKRWRDDSGRKRAGQRDGLVHEEDQRAWIQRRGEAGGFRILECRITPRGLVHSVKQSRQLTHLCVEFDGILQATDPARLREAVACGIGSGKAFGFGLLSLAPLQ